MPVGGECKNLTLLTSKRGALATDTRGCSLWRYLLERPPPAWESRVQDPLEARTSCGGVDPGGGVTRAFHFTTLNSCSQLFSSGFVLLYIYCYVPGRICLIPCTSVMYVVTVCLFIACFLSLSLSVISSDR